MSSNEDSFDVDSNVDLSRPLSSYTGRPSLHRECSGNCRSPHIYSNNSSFCRDKSEMVIGGSPCQERSDVVGCCSQEESRDEVDRAVRIQPTKTSNKSKSLPTTPAQESRARTYHGISPQQQSRPKYSPESYKNNSNSPSRSDSSNSALKSNSPVNQNQNASLKNGKSRDESTDQSTSIPWSYYSAIGVLVMIFAAYCYNTMTNSTVPEMSTHEQKFTNHFEKFRTNLVEFQEHYNMNSYTMLFLKDVVEQTWNDSSTSGFVFVYGRQCDGTIDETKAFTFATEYARIVANFMRNNTDKPIQHVDVHSDNLQMPTKGELIMEYKDKLDERGVLLLRRVDALSDTLAQDLHYYCDDVTPLVPRSVVLFTINMRSCGSCEMPDKNVARDEKPQQSVKKCLSSKWRKLKSSVLTPLLTRILNIVIDLDPILFK